MGGHRFRTSYGNKLKRIFTKPFKVLAKVGAVAYKLELPQELSRVHSTCTVLWRNPVESMDRRSQTVEANTGRQGDVKEKMLGHESRVKARAEGTAE
ncbi:hypothetical protein Tco_1499071 [Tanacetum coccineum]